MSSKVQTWRSYEELARHVLLHFGDLLGISEAEAKQRLMGKTGAEWEIDAKGVMTGGRGFLVIECKERSTARLNQAAIGSLAFTVEDVGAAGAIIVTNTGLQEGAGKVAKHHDFKIVYLPKDGTFEEFFASCGNYLLRGVSERVSNELALASFVVFPTEKK
jgi:hypothetical protein